MVEEKGRELSKILKKKYFVIGVIVRHAGEPECYGRLLAECMG
jgi:hypothetical protein